MTEPLVPAPEIANSRARWIAPIILGLTLGIVTYLANVAVATRIVMDGGTAAPSPLYYANNILNWPFYALEELLGGFVSHSIVVGASIAVHFTFCMLLAWLVVAARRALIRTAR